uniref:4'-phosphopantetheine phosphatase n=1 Tax=Pelusios castaneus TaxID=367368 RepID=A0A8C8RMD3_9SAUR
MAERGGRGTSSGGASSLDKSITLPPDEIFRNLENAKSFAIDIVARVRSFDYSGKDIEHESPYEITVQEEITARLHFIKFENTYIETCLDFIKDHLVNTETKVIKATGEDVMTCLIKGCNFVLKNIPHEVFAYQKDSETEFRFQTNHPNIFPYLLVNIGSGVSIVKVETEDKFEWIGGSSIGGGTFWGLGALLTKTKKFDELLQLASKGKHTNVDMLVKDVYGGAYQTLGLSGNLIASSFGKSATADKEFSKDDMAKSLLHMISNDIGQLACLYAKLHNLHKIYFGGFFIRGHPVTMRTITYSINFFSKGEVQALFLRHEGYLGAIGAFLKGAEQDNPNQYSWGENYAGSSGLMSTSPDLSPMQRARSSTFDMFEMDRLERPLVNLPLLKDPSTYIPDTVDLTDDTMARKYWLTCFEEALDGVVKRAIASQPDSIDAAERAEKFRQKYWNKLQTLRQQPFAYGTLTVRSLLDTREHCLNEFNFPDPYSKLNTNESLNYENRKLNPECTGFLLQEGPPHKCALIFADNKLLSRGTEVILACNSGPALNDVTYSESLIVTERIAAMDPIIQSALKEERLLLVQTGSSSPCLDLSRLDKGLALLVRERKTDLVIIEGMGRAIHTNYYAALKCESLKLAVIKNSWLADRLGGKIFSVIFKYEVPSE